MYIRAIQIIESFRNEKGQPRQKIVRHLGTALTDKEVEAIEKLRAKLEKNVVFLEFC